MSAELIGSIRVSPTTAQPGETVKVEVLNPTGQLYRNRDDTRITINGVPGSVRYLQFKGVGERTVRVRAVRGAIREKAQATVHIAGDPLTFQAGLDASTTTQFARLRVRQVLGHPYRAVFYLGEPTRTDRKTRHDKTQRFAGLAGSKSAQVPIVAAASPPKLKPKIGSRIRPLLPAEVTTLLDRAKATKRRYKWDFGDGKKATTTGPMVTHDYFPSTDPEQLQSTFHVRCRVTDSGIDVTRTLVLYSAHSLCKQRGTIVLHTVQDVFAERFAAGFSGSFIVYNPESVPLTLNKQAIAPLAPNGKEKPRFTIRDLASAIALPARSATVIALYVPAAAKTGQGCLAHDVEGFNVYYTGTAENGTPVRVSATFEVGLAKRRLGTGSPIAAKKWPWKNILGSVTSIATAAGSAIVKSRNVHLDEPTGTIVLGLDGGLDTYGKARVHRTVRRAVTAGLDAVRTIKVTRFLVPLSTTGPLPTRTLTRSSTSVSGPPTAGSVSEGEICDPDNLSEEDLAKAKSKKLACQLTDKTVEALMPGRFMNACKGDTILSPGGTGVIGSLLRGVDPPQLYSHSGIMSRNYDEITHSTASEDRLEDYLEGERHVRPDILKYLWPGTITQSVEASVNGEKWVDPENGKRYLIVNFSPHSIGVSHNDDFVVVPPVVVKPDPMQETSAIRQMLHQVADSAAEMGGQIDDDGNVIVSPKGHYRFYCYSDSAIAESKTAGSDAGWAKGTVPTVCSVFIWLNMRKHGVHLESGTSSVMPTDLEASDVAAGALVFPGTPDGLYGYTTDERLACAEWLYDTIYDGALDEAGWLGEILTDAADDIACQVVNTFANDDAEGWNSKKWRSVGDANLVSPDNILMWDAPEQGGLYGYCEPLIYREPRVETYTISRWQKVVNSGKITGKVFLNGKPVAGAHVQVYDGKSDLTNDSGEYVLEDVPYGTYTLKAYRLVDDVYYSKEVSVSLSSGSRTLNVTLEAPSDSFRLAGVYIDFSGKDHEPWTKLWNAGDEIYDPGPEYYELELGPDRVVNELSLQYKWGGELRVEFKISVALLVDNSIKVTVTGWLYEGTKETTKDLDGQKVVSMIVAQDETETTAVKITNTAENKDDMGYLAISVKNAQNNN